MEIFHREAKRKIIKGGEKLIVLAEKVRIVFDVENNFSKKKLSDALFI